MQVKMIIEILNLIFGLLPIAEKLFEDKPKSGAEKKEMVVETTRGVIGALEAASTGGQKGTWGIIGRVIEPFIDLACKLLNAFGVFKT